MPQNTPKLARVLDEREVLLEYLEEAIARLEANQILDDLPFLVGAKTIVRLARKAKKREIKRGP